MKTIHKFVFLRIIRRRDENAHLNFVFFKKTGKQKKWFGRVIGKGVKCGTIVGEQSIIRLISAD